MNNGFKALVISTIFIAGILLLISSSLKIMSNDYYMDEDKKDYVLFNVVSIKENTYMKKESNGEVIWVLVAGVGSYNSKEELMIEKILVIESNSKYLYLSNKNKRTDVRILKAMLTDGDITSIYEFIKSENLKSVLIKKSNHELHIRKV